MEKEIQNDDGTSAFTSSENLKTYIENNEKENVLEEDLVEKKTSLSTTPILEKMETDAHVKMKRNYLNNLETLLQNKVVDKTVKVNLNSEEVGATRQHVELLHSSLTSELIRMEVELKSLENLLAQKQISDQDDPLEKQIQETLVVIDALRDILDGKNKKKSDDKIVTRTNKINETEVDFRGRSHYRVHGSRQSSKISPSGPKPFVVACIKRGISPSEIIAKQEHEKYIGSNEEKRESSSRRSHSPNRSRSPPHGKTLIVKDEFAVNSKDTDSDEKKCSIRGGSYPSMPSIKETFAECTYNIKKLVNDTYHKTVPVVPTVERPSNTSKSSAANAKRVYNASPCDPKLTSKQEQHKKAFFCANSPNSRDKKQLKRPVSQAARDEQFQKLLQQALTIHKPQETELRSKSAGVGSAMREVYRCKGDISPYLPRKPSSAPITNNISPKKKVITPKK